MVVCFLCVWCSVRIVNYSSFLIISLALVLFADRGGGGDDGHDDDEKLYRSAARSLALLCVVVAHMLAIHASLENPHIRSMMSYEVSCLLFAFFLSGGFVQATYITIAGLCVCVCAVPGTLFARAPHSHSHSRLFPSTSLSVYVLFSSISTAVFFYTA